MSTALTPHSKTPPLSLWVSHWCGSMASQVLSAIGGLPNREWDANPQGGRTGSKVMGGYALVEISVKGNILTCHVQYNASGEERDVEVQLPVTNDVGNIVQLLAQQGIRNMALSRTAATQKSWGDGNPSAPQTPWGPAQYGTQVETGVWLFNTAGHGGLMVRPGVAQKKLSPAARKCGEFWGGAYWYEEDVAMNIPLFENFDWAQTLGTRAPIERYERSIREYFPEYFQYLAAGHREPTRVKVGDKLVFRETVRYGQGLVLQAEDTGTVVKTTPAMIVIVADKYRMKFKVPVAYLLDGKVAKG